MSLDDDIRLYLAEQRAIIDAFPVEAVRAAADMLFDTYDAGGTVFAMGNGGNAGTLDHARTATSSITRSCPRTRAHRSLRR